MWFSLCALQVKLCIVLRKKKKREGFFLGSVSSDADQCTVDIGIMDKKHYIQTGL